VGVHGDDVVGDGGGDVEHDHLLTHVRVRLAHVASGVVERHAEVGLAVVDGQHRVVVAAREERLVVDTVGEVPGVELEDREDVPGGRALGAVGYAATGHHAHVDG